jgi:hypothetical protein
MNPKSYILLPAILSTVLNASAQKTIPLDTVRVEARAWYRDSIRNIRYADWKSYPTVMLRQTIGSNAKSLDNSCPYGGDKSRKVASPGYFRALKQGGRWMLVDPHGHPFIAAAVNSFRQGKSPDNKKAFTERFGDDTAWAGQSVRAFRADGFNMLGSWGDTAAIRSWNRYSRQPFPYCTQLNLLSGYVSEARRKDPRRRDNPNISFILDADFATYCDRQAARIAYLKDDPSLFGHFSDNEIAFMHTVFAEILRIPDSTDACRQAAADFMRKNGVDASTIDRDRKEAFIATLAEVYFKTVSQAIRKHDPNHLYVGSRLHSSAKDNPHLFRAAHPYVDVISINYYGQWAPGAKQMADWAAWSDRPFFITEFYTKAEDSGLPNITGAGWLVHTQRDRGLHYQNFCLALLQASNNVGWHWFRYQDNDPADPDADPSNNDSNKGLVDKYYRPHTGMTDVMRPLNLRKYELRKAIGEGR